MATTDAEQLGGIRTNWRDVSGISGTDEISDEAINIRINDFYKTTFVNDIQHDSLESDFTQAATVDDDGEYTLAASVLEVKDRATFNGGDICQYFDRSQFFAEYPDQEDYITNPTLVIGTSSAAAVKNSAFNYKIGNWVYTGAAGETALSGDNVPQSKYGAWMLSIDSDGTITVTAASDNSTGYATAALAVNGINTSTSDAVMGFVTAINTSGVFDPGTTELSAAGVTDTFTDGNPGYRNTPNAFLVEGRKLYLRPKPSDTGLFKSKFMFTRPDELDSDTASVFDEKWGMAIALGDASAYWATHGDIEKSQELNGTGDMPGTYKYLIARINRDWYKQRNKNPMERAW